jgi:hypothetical protein
MSITITVSEKTEKKIRQHVAETGQDIDEVVGSLVDEVWDEHFPKGGSTREQKPHSLFRLAGKYSSSRTDTSERMSEVLYSEDLDPAQGFGTDK